MRSSNIIWHSATVKREHLNQLNNHRSVVVWFTGLSGAGKTTLANAVAKELHRNGCRTFVLDGDNVRHGLSSDLGFSLKDRHEHIRRAGEVAKLMMEAGIITLTAFISPFKSDRKFVRSLLNTGDFIEVYCKASLETCVARDVKGQYKRALAGEIKNYTGIDSPYEEPENPEAVIDTEELNLNESIQLVKELLIEQGIIY